MREEGGGGPSQKDTKDEQVSYRYDTPASTFTSVILLILLLCSR